MAVKNVEWWSFHARRYSSVMARVLLGRYSGTDSSLAYTDCTATGSTLGQHTRTAGHLQRTPQTEHAHTELRNTTFERKIIFWWVTDLCCVTTAGGAVCRVGDTAKICCQARHVRCVPSGVLCQHFQITIHTVIQEGRMVSLPGDFTHRLHYNYITPCISISSMIVWFSRNLYENMN